MSKVVLFIATSLDGYIADKDGGIDWLTAFGGEDEDFGYQAFYNTLSATIQGATTYEQVLTFGEFPYKGVENVVVTSRALPKPQGDADVTFYNSDDFPALVAQLKQKHENDIWLIGGGKLVSAFVNHNLIDEYRITIIPLLLGAGIPLFQGVNGYKPLKHTRTHTFTQGVIELTYVRKP